MERGAFTLILLNYLALCLILKAFTMVLGSLSLCSCIRWVARDYNGLFRTHSHLFIVKLFLFVDVEDTKFAEF